MKKSTLEKLKATLGTAPRALKSAKPEQFVAEDYQTFSTNLEQQIAVQTVGDGLRQARVRRKISSRELAKQLSLSQTRIINLEKANTELELRTVAKVAEQLGYSLKLELIPNDTNEPTISVTMPQSRIL